MPGMIGVESLPIIAYLTIAIVCLNALVMAGVSMIHPREPGPSIWALGNMLAAVGVTIMTVRAPQNEPLVALLGNAMFVGSYACLWIGCARFRLRPPPWLLITAVVAIWFTAFLWYLLASPDAVARVTVTALVLTAICFCIAAIVLHRIEPGLLQTQGFLGLIFGMLGMLYLLRAVAALAGLLEQADFGAGPLGSGIFLIPAAAGTLATLSCTLMLSQRLQLHLQVNSQTDPLTGLLNRGLFNDLGEKEAARARRHGYGLCLLAFDIDHFKRINQQHGYAAGDALLREIAALVGTTLRREDHFGRLDGAQFCIMLPSTRLSGAQQLAERLRQTIAGRRLESGPQVTASFGIAAFGLHGDDWTSLMQRAETALYRAKTEGRNRVETAPLSDAAFATPA
jgi:diguanylate cyclase (GGDEF)-like protein